MMHLRLITLAIPMLLLSGCGTTAGSSDSQGSLMDALMAVHAQSRIEAEPQQAAFEKRMLVGMTQEEVLRTAASIGQEFGDRSGRSHTVRASGDVVVTSSGTVCFQSGEPASRSREEGAGIEVWEYNCFDKVYMLTFSEGRLSDIASRRFSANEGVRRE